MNHIPAKPLTKSLSESIKMVMELDYSDIAHYERAKAATQSSKIADKSNNPEGHKIAIIKHEAAIKSAMSARGPERLEQMRYHLDKVNYHKASI